MQSTNGNRRLGTTRFFVPDPSFSWYVRGVALGSLVAVVLFSGLLWWYHGRLLDVLGLYDRLSEPGMREVIIRYAKLSLLVTGASVLGAATWMILLSVFFLHRIAGPIYRLKVHMIDMMAGEGATELSFRKDDQLKDLSDIFNEFMHHFGLLEAGETHPSSADQTLRTPSSSRL